MICCSVNRLFLMSVILRADGPHFHSGGTAIGEHVNRMFFQGVARQHDLVHR